MNDPRTPAEWQQAVDGAHAVSLIEAARRLGFIGGGPTVNLQRCADILNEGLKLGYKADPLGVYEYLNDSGAPVEVHKAMVKLQEMAEGGLLSAALLGTPLRGYALDHIYTATDDAQASSPSTDLSGGSR